MKKQKISRKEKLTDGWITIGTKLDSNSLDKDLRDSERKLKQYEREAEKLTKQKAKIDIDLSSYEAEKTKIQEETDEILKQANAEEQVNYILESEKIQLEDLETKYKKILDKNNEITKELEENISNQGLLNTKVSEMKEKLSQTQGYNEVKKSIDNIGNSMSSIIGKVAKWSLAIFSVRSAYSLISSSMSTLSQYDEQMATDIEYIRYALASALKPVIEGIIQLVYKLLAYVNYLAQAWFGVNLFAKAGADNFAKVSSGIKDATNNAKELNKQLTGFDEMNVLQENGQVSTGGGGGGTTLPSVDLGNIQDVEIPSWLKWIKDNGELIAGLITGIGLALLGFKIGNFISNITNSGKALQGFGDIVSSATFLTGLTILITHLSNLITHWNSLDTSEKAAEVVFVAFGVALMALAVVIRTAIDTATFGVAEIISLVVIAIAGLVAGISELTSVLNDNNGRVFDATEAQENLTDAINNTKQATENYANFLDNYDNAVKRAEEATEKLTTVQNETGISIDKLLEKMEEENLSYIDLNDNEKKVYKAYYDNMAAQDNLKKSTQDLEEGVDAIVEAKKTEHDAYWKNEVAIAQQNKSYDKLKEKVIDAFKNGELSAESARDIIARCMGDMSEDAAKTFGKDIPKEIKEGLDPQQYHSNGYKLGKFFENTWNEAFKSVKDTFNSIGKFFGFSSGGVTTGKTGFYNGGIIGFENGGVTRNVVKCANGSIINQPGRGVPISTAVGGERGQEGIIPLTNSQMMEQLGQAIGRYITVNTQMNNYMNGRLISREIQKVQNNSDFAMNR